jgi:hypothetical protein
MDAGEQLAGVKAASFTAAGAGMSEYVYCPGMDVDNKRFTANRKAFGLTTLDLGRALRRHGPGDISGGRPREGGQRSGRALGRRAARGAVAQRREGRGDLLHGWWHVACWCCTSPAAWSSRASAAARAAMAASGWR